MERYNFLTPVLEHLLFFQIVPVVENCEARRNLGRLELISNDSVKFFLASLLQGASDTPGVGPCKKTIEEFLFVVVRSFETLGFIDEILNEVAYGNNLL
jgi:hypothetical protein